LVNSINVGIRIKGCDLLSLFTVLECGFRLYRVLVIALSPITSIIFQFMVLHHSFSRFVQFLGLCVISWIIVQSLGLAYVGSISRDPKFFEVLGCFVFFGMFSSKLVLLQFFQIFQCLVFVDDGARLGLDTCLFVLCQRIGHFNCLEGYRVILGVMFLGYSEIEKLVSFAPLMWKFGDDIIDFRFWVHDSTFIPSS